MYSTERPTTMSPHVGHVGSRITLESLTRSTISRPISPPTDNRWKEEVPTLRSSTNGIDNTSLDRSSRSIEDLLPKKKERKLFTSSRKKWRNVGRRFSSPFAGMLRTSRANAKLKGTRGTLLLFHAETKQRIHLAEKLEHDGYNVEQHSIPEQAMGALRTHSSIAGAIVAINPQLKHDTALEFLGQLGATTDRLVDISVALLPSEEDRQAIEAMARGKKHKTFQTIEHLRRGISVQLSEARKSRHVRCEVRNPAEQSEVESLLIRFEQMCKRESQTSKMYSKANKFDFEHKKRYMKSLESRRYSSGHRVGSILAGRPRKLKKTMFLAWKMIVREGAEKEKANIAATKKAAGKQGMVRGRKQALLRRLKTKAKAVSASRQAWHKTITNSITHDRLIKRSLLPSWLPLRMRKLYLADNTSERDLKRAVRIFSRMVRRRSEVWPRACRALAYCRVSELSNDSSDLRKAAKELSICIERQKSEKERAGLFYNRSVIKLRQGKTVAALKDLAEVIEMYNNDKRHVEEKFVEAALNNRQLIQRRFGNFLLSFQDLTLVKQIRKEREERQNPEKNNSESESSEDETGYSDGDGDGNDNGTGNGAANHQMKDLTSPKLSSSNSKEMQNLASFRLDSTPSTGSQTREKRTSLTFTETSDSESESESDSEYQNKKTSSSSSRHLDTPIVRRGGGRRGSMIGTVGYKRSKTKVDDDDGKDHALDLLQQFNDQQLEKKVKILGTKNQDETEEAKEPPTHMETLMMSKNEKSLKIKKGVQSMFNKSLPADVFEALSVPIQLRTRKHWKAIRFCTDTMAAFSNFPEALKDHLVKVLTLHHARFNSPICRYGDEADNFYLIVSGYLRVEVPNPADKKNMLVVNRMNPGTAFGELSLVFDQKRAASVIVDSKQSMLLVIPKAQFKLLGLAQYHLAKLQDKYKTLCQCSIFDSWTDESLTALAQIAQVKHFSQDAQIIKQDSRPDHLHILRKGVVQIFSSTDELGELKREESALQYNLDRQRKKHLVSRLVDAEKHVLESKVQEMAMHQRLKVVKKEIKKCVMLPKPKANTSISTLFAPAFFGEYAVVAPDRGERYTAVAETYCETLQIARPQIKSKWIGPIFVAALKRGMVRIPPGEELRKLEKIRNEWAGKKSRVCEIIDTSRHPSTDNLIGKKKRSKY